MTFKTATIIATYNGMQWIEECIESVIEDTQVIVVDNKSTDGTVEFIKKNFTEVILIEQNQNLGFGKANNIGISYAINNDAQYVLLLNQDAKIQSGSIDKLIEASKNNKDFGILSPIHCDWEGHYLESSFADYISYHKNKDFYSDFVLAKSLKEVYEVPFVAAACWFIRADAIKAVGGFDPIFKHLGEDVNLSQRFRFHGFKIGVLPNCIVMHDTKERIYEKIEKFSDAYYYKFDYRSKMKYANLNIPNWEEKLSYDKNQLWKELILCLIRLRIKDAKGYFKQIKYIEDIKSHCASSRALNEVKGSHYLN
ncbi:glycosyltransferase family 2 protein [Winogradskyella alexanderae]|uniref:Glycosyltransferase family 2 protein n=1 Tax=Winogradskyella alexanderae TaxID=2877123 RepID=A0ABS7XPP4_9FLAO|nr:glycosyltransferase family 2 protein [Winogradskyella alexanderae]MCA0131980.1 glycosyltransferase family 2 protein [Winogradskyella alexanderae]